MRKIIATEFMTLDGVVEDPGGAENTKYGGWSFKSWSEESANYKLDELFSADTQLLGRITYDGFAKAWPSMKDEAGFADKMNNMPKYVVSTTLEELDWNNSHLIKENINEEILKLKEQPGSNILIAGSIALTQTLLQSNLIDELRLMIHPVILGSGRRLFENITDMKNLNLLWSKNLPKGVILLCYEPVKN